MLQASKQSIRFITSTNFSRYALLALIVPVAAYSTAIKASGTTGPTICEVGSCPDPNSTATSVGISPAAPATAGSINFTYMFANGDQFKVTGIYDANYKTGVFIEFAPVITYIGNNGNAAAPSAGIDTLSLDLLQNFYDNSGGVWSSPPSYCEHVNLNVGGTSASGTLSFDGQSIGTLSAGPGISVQNACANLSFNAAQDASAYLNGDYNITATFANGTTPGTITSSPTPEPSTVAFTLLSGLFLISARSRWQRRRES
jgi:hypothetical protein